MFGRAESLVAGRPSGARVATAPTAGAMHSPRSYLGAVRVFSVPRDERPCVDLEGTRHATARESWCSRLLGAPLALLFCVRWSRELFIGGPSVNEMMRHALGSNTGAQTSFSRKRPALSRGPTWPRPAVI